jgi:hypothetical protein
MLPSVMRKIPMIFARICGCCSEKDGVIGYLSQIAGMDIIQKDLNDFIVFVVHVAGSFCHLSLYYFVVVMCFCCYSPA